MKNMTSVRTAVEKENPKCARFSEGHRISIQPTKLAQNKQPNNGKRHSQRAVLKRGIIRIYQD